MPDTNLDLIDSFTAKAYYRFVLNSPFLNLHISPKCRVGITVSDLFSVEKFHDLTEIVLEPSKLQSRNLKHIPKHLIRYSLTVLVVAIVSPIGSVVDGIRLVINVVRLPSRQIIYWMKNEKILQNEALEEDWSKVKRYADAWFRETLLATTFYLSFLPVSMGSSYLGLFYVLSLPAFISFSSDKCLKILLPARVRAAFMKTLLFRDRFGVVDAKKKLLSIDPESDDEVLSQGYIQGSLAKLYLNAAGNLYNLLETNNIKVYWEQEESVHGKDLFLKEIKNTCPVNEVYKSIEDALYLMWTLREMLSECVWCRELSILHDVRALDEKRVKIPDILKLPETNNQTPRKEEREKWEDVLKSALRVIEETKEKLKLSEIKVPQFDDENKKRLYALFRNKVSEGSLTPSKLFTNPANTSAAKLFFAKHTLVIHPDKLPQGTSEVLINEAKALFDLLYKTNEELKESFA